MGKQILPPMKGFKKLILEMYDDFPMGYVSEQIISEIVTLESIRELLVKNGYFHREIFYDPFFEKKEFSYMLGPNSLSLVTAWKVEELTKVIVVMTIATIAIGLITLYLTI